MLFSDDFYNAGIRHKEMKLLLGNPGKPDGWTPPPEVMEISKDDSKIHEFTELFRMSDVSTCEAKPVRLYNLTHDPFEKGCKTSNYYYCRAKNPGVVWPS